MSKKNFQIELLINMNTYVRENKHTYRGMCEEICRGIYIVHIRNFNNLVFLYKRHMISITKYTLYKIVFECCSYALTPHIHKWVTIWFDFIGSYKLMFVFVFVIYACIIVQVKGTLQLTPWSQENYMYTDRWVVDLVWWLHLQKFFY